MALTIKEQLDIINGVVTPNDSIYTLEQLVNQVAINYAEDLQVSFKTVDPVTDPLAYSYMWKLMSIIQQLRSNGSNRQVPSIIVGIGADTANFPSIEDAPTSTWVTFLENNIAEAFELVAGVIPSEKVAYDNLVVTTTTTTTQA